MNPLKRKNSSMEHVDSDYTTVVIKSEPAPLMEAGDLLRSKNTVLLNILSLYEENRCLWDTECENYANRVSREEAWASVYAYYKKNVVYPDEKRMRHVIENARHSWRREFRNVKASMLIGDKYKPKLWYFHALNFLAEVERDKNGSDNDISADVVMENDSEELNQRMSANDLLKQENPVLLKLFSLYEQNRCLWDTGDANYLNRKEREVAWAALYDYYKKVVFKPERTRMRSILSHARSSWRREARAVKASMLNGGSLYQPRLWYFNALNFLAVDTVDNSVDGTEMDSDHAYLAKHPSAYVEINSTENDDDEIPESYPGWAEKLSSTDLLKDKNPFLLNLFSMFRRNRCLWDSNDENYGNRDFRQHAWRAIYKYYKEVVRNPDEKRMRNLFSNTRSCWRREFKQVKASMLTGDGENVYQPKLWYYSALNFLAGIAQDGEETEADHDANSVRRSMRTVNKPLRFSDDTYDYFVVDEDETGNNDDQCELEPSDSEVMLEGTSDTRRLPNRKKCDLAIQAKAAMIQAAQRLISSETEEDDMWVTQGKAWGQRLSAIESKQRTIAMKLIGDVLYYADMGMLTHAAAVNPGTSS